MQCAKSITMATVGSRMWAISIVVLDRRWARPASDS